VTARLATLSGGRRWRVSYPVQIASLVVVAVVLLWATNFFGTPNQADAQYGQLLAAIAIIIAFARLLGAVAQRIGQPRVMGEILAGILLGPTLFGLLPKFVSGLCTPAQGQSTCSWPFSPGTTDGLHAAAEIGLVFYMFLVGLELDPTVIRQRAREAAAISLTSVILPFTLGVIAALYLLQFGSTYGDGNRPLAFITFTGVAMSVTAFPVLARILVERRMIRGPIGGLALACAAIRRRGGLVAARPCNCLRCERPDAGRDIRLDNCRCDCAARSDRDHRPRPGVLRGDGLRRAPGRVARGDCV